MKQLITGLYLCTFFFTSGQNVGIGTPTPKAKLEISNPLHAKLMISSLSYSDSSSLIFSNRTGVSGTDFILSQNREQGLRFSSVSDLPINTNANIMQVMPSGSIGIGTTPASQASLDLGATNKGLLVNRLTSVQRKAIPSPQEGLLVFDTDKKCLYIFSGGDWRPLAFEQPGNALPAERAASDGVAGDQFGYSVSISGNYAVVGAPFTNISAKNDQGAVYVFVKNGSNWTQLTKLIASDGQADDYFGSAVNISGDYIVIGARGADPGGFANQGAAYVFFRSGVDIWTQQAKLVTANSITGGNFGASVATNGNYVLVGAPYETIAGNIQEGSAYVFARSGTNWNQQGRFYSNLPHAYSHFGWSVAISSSPLFLAIGAPYELNVYGRTYHTTYIYTYSGTWNRVQSLNGYGNTISNGYQPSNYGVVAISGKVIDGPHAESFTSGDLPYPYSNYVTPTTTVDAFPIPDDQALSSSTISQAYTGTGIIAASGNYMLAGDPGTSYPGRVCLLKYGLQPYTSQYTVIKIFEDPSAAGANIGGFGNAVAIDGNNMIIARSDAQSGAGKVYFVDITE